MKMHIQDIEIAYEEHGNGEPVFLVHGFPLNRSIWYPMLPFLPKTYRWILPDLRGYGESSVTDGVYRMDVFARDLVSLMDSLEISKANFLGHSMGGYVCLALARRYPKRINGLGMIASQAAADTDERRKGRYATVEQVLRNGVESIAETMAQKLSVNETLQPTLIDIIRSASTQAVIGSLKGMAERDDMLPYLPLIEIPTLVIGGRADTLISIERSREMAEILSYCTLVEFPEASHMPMMEDPESTARAILGWLEAVKR